MGSNKTSLFIVLVTILGDVFCHFLMTLFISFHTSTRHRKSGILLIEVNHIPHDSSTHTGFPMQSFFEMHKVGNVGSKGLCME